MYRKEAEKKGREKMLRMTIVVKSACRRKGEGLGLGLDSP
jgi:hypothetical protein